MIASRFNHLFIVPPRRLLLGSCPQLLDAALRTTQHPVDEKTVGVGRYLGRYPYGQPNERGGQALSETEGPFEAGDGDLDLLPEPRSSRTGFAANQHDPRLGQLLLELLTSVGQVPKQLTCYLAPEVRLGQELFGQREIRYV